MKNKSCVWLVCMLLCIAVKGNAQVITLENGFSITSMRAKKASTNKVYPYQMSLGYQYLVKAGIIYPAISVIPEEVVK